MNNPHFFWGYSTIRMIGNGLTSYWKLLIPYFAIDFGLNGFEVGLVAHLRDIMGIFGTAIAYSIFRKIHIVKVIPTQLLAILGILVSILFIQYFEGEMRILFLIVIGCCVSMVMRINIVAQYQVLHAVKISEKERGRYLGTMQSMGDIGSFAVVTIGGLLIVHYGWAYATGIAIGGVLLLSVLFFYVRSRLNIKNYTSESFEKKISLRSWGSRKAFLTILVLMTDAAAGEGMIIFLPLLLMQNGISLDLFPYISGSLMCGAMMGRRLGGMSDDYGYKKMFLILESVMIIILLAFTVVNVFWVAMIGAFFIGLGLRGTSPIKGVLLMKAVPKKYFHKLHTCASNANALVGIFAGLLWGTLATVFDYTVPFYGMALFGCMSMIAIVFLHRVRD